MKCARIACGNELPLQKTKGRLRLYCSRRCNRYVERGAETTFDPDGAIDTRPRGPIPFEQHDVGACERCREQHWLYSRVGETTKLCAGCALKAVLPTADYERYVTASDRG